MSSSPIPILPVSTSLSPQVTYLRVRRHSSCHFSMCVSHSVVSDSLWPHGLQHPRIPHLFLLQLMSIESVKPSNHLILCVHVSSCLQSFPSSKSFSMKPTPPTWSYSALVSLKTALCPKSLNQTFCLSPNSNSLCFQVAASTVLTAFTLQPYKHFLFNMKSLSPID